MVWKIQRLNETRIQISDDDDDDDDAWQNGPLEARVCQITTGLTSTCQKTEVNGHPGDIVSI